MSRAALTNESEVPKGKWVRSQGPRTGASHLASRMRPREKKNVEIKIHRQINVEELEPGKVVEEVVQGFEVRIEIRGQSIRTF